MLGYALVAVLAALVGFVAGFATFKRSQHWCPECGALITRSHCPRLLAIPWVQVPTERPGDLART
ncbi:MAG: hypothetical protein HKP61_17695 [Dactylosporangium sp.]|nr:hypothetical protein [Dactylosporangium sp.]NNJ62731.1 hypothetical protein [Dactylosporangium sp.]